MIKTHGGARDQQQGQKLFSRMSSAPDETGARDDDDDKAMEKARSPFQALTMNSGKTPSSSRSITPSGKTLPPR